MTRLLFHTTLLVDAERSDTDLDEVVRDADDVAVAAVTIAELLVGVKLATALHRPGRQAYVNDLISTIPIIDYDISVAVAHAELLAAVREAGRPRGAHDLIIAATAAATGREVVTADSGAFKGLPGVAYRTYR